MIRNTLPHFGTLGPIEAPVYAIEDTGCRALGSHLTQGLKSLNKAGSDQIRVVFRFAIKLLRLELDCNVVRAVKVCKSLECYTTKSEEGRVLEEHPTRKVSECSQNIFNNTGTKINTHVA
jgi:hypothetical protein